MKKTFTKIMFLLFALIVGIGNACGQTSWQKVTSAPSNWSGEYLIVYENSSTEGYCWTGVDAASCYASATISSGNISSKPSGAVSVTIASMTGGYSIKVNGGDNNGKYIQNNGSSNGIKFVDSGVATTFTYENSSVTITCGGKNFRYNSNSSDKRFRYYGSAQQVVQLYKKAHTLTYLADHGNIGGVVYNTTTAVNSGASIAEGGKVTLTANPDDGYAFSSWSDGNDNTTLSSTTDNPTTFTMGTSDVTITANFTASGGATTYSVTYNANGATSGAVPTDDNSYEANYPVTVLGNTGNLVKTGNAFSGWCMNAEGTGTVYGPNNTTSFNITSNTTLYAKWTPYTITAASSNNNYGTVALNGNVISATPAEGYRVNISTPYSIDPANSAEIVQNGNEFTVTPTANTTVTINFEAIPTYTASFSVNGTIDPANNCTVAVGAHITFPSNPAAISGKPFMGWYTEVYTNATTAPSYVNTTTVTMGDSDVTYYAVFADETAGTPVTDELTTSTFGSPSSYTSWSGKQATDGSNAVYAGNSTTYTQNSSNAIQLRASSGNQDPSGIVSTTSGGKATKVTVSWNSGTADSRTLDVYGKNTAYSDASDLYSNTTQGSSLGSLYYKVKINNVTTTTTELTITGNYKFIGLRSNSGAMYLDEIDIQWTPVTYANYSTSVEVKTITDLSYTGTPTKTTYSAGESFDPTGLTVTATYDDNSEEDVTEDVIWTPDPLTQGTTSVTGTFMELTVNITGLTVKAAAGTETNPYTVAQAIANTPSSGTLSNVYIHGIVSAFYSSTITGDETYHRYYISDNGTTSNQLLVFNGKKRIGTAFSDDDDIRVGDIVTIYGGLTTYSNTKEVAADNYIVSHQLVAPTFSPAAGAVLSGTTVAISDAHTTNTTIYYTTDGSIPTTNSPVYSTPIEITANTTIKAIANKTSDYNTSDVATAEYTIILIPTITVTAENPVNVSAAAGSGELALTYANFEVENADDFAVQFYNANNEEINDPNWIVVLVEDADPSGYKVSYEVSANNGVARSAYFKVYALADDYVYSNLVTLTQAAADYATLPFTYAGGVLADYNTLPGTSYSLNDQGSYAEGNAPYRIKFTKTGDYLQIKTDSRLGVVSIDVKMLGGSNTSKITVQESETGNNNDWSKVEDLTISGSQNDVVNLVTTTAFDTDSRYVRLVFDKGSNVGVGPITIDISGPKTITDLTIPANNIITIGTGCVLTVTGDITNNGDEKNLIIADGGQLILPDDASVAATVQKEVLAASQSKDYIAPFGWYSISSSVNNAKIAGDDANTNLITASGYDLYRYNETVDAQQWENYHANDDFTHMTNGRGYLYRNETNHTIEFTGTVNTGNVEYTVTKTEVGALSGFNLIGNPYTHDIYKGTGGAIVNSVENGYELATGYYVATNSGAWEAKADNTDPIVKNQGILVQAVKAGTITMTNTPNGYIDPNAKANHDNIKFMVSNSQYEDVAYAMFDKGNGLNKISHRNAEIPMLYIPQNDENYAIAMMSDDTQSFGLNFKAMTMGKYTLSYKADGQFSYLHVIDRLTGEDVDMLLEESYSFVGTPKDAENRFIVKLNYQSGLDSSDNSTFAYQSGNDIIVSGEGTLQIFDVMGRMIATQNINGVETVNVPANGVYVFRLNEKVQKVVVK